jgi:hypothetical protein
MKRQVLQKHNSYIREQKDFLVKALLILGVFLCFATSISSALDFFADYDNDDSPFTNPTSDLSLSSFSIGKKQLIFATIVIEPEPGLVGEEAKLTIWNDEDTFEYTTTVDQEGNAVFALSMEYSPSGYNYQIKIESTHR